MNPDTSLKTVSGWLLETNLAIKPPLKQTVVKRGRLGLRIKGARIKKIIHNPAFKGVFARGIPAQVPILMENPG
jgi:hypothetical protein